EAVAAEAIPGGFGVVYPVLKAMEDGGRLRRGYFVAGRGGAPLPLAGALRLPRSLRRTRGDPPGNAISASGPASPYRAALKWTPPAAGGSAGRTPEQGPASPGRGATRTVGATVIMVDGALAAYVARGDRSLLVVLPDDEPRRSRVARAIAHVLIERARAGGET